MQKADHSGHRARMRERYLKSGLDSFAPHEILELLLYYAVPYRNTNDIAKQLIDRFGSLSAVFETPVDSLMEAGLTENQAIYLKLISDVTRAYYVDKYETDDGPVDYDSMPAYILSKFIGLGAEERVLLLLCDDKYKEVYCGFIAEGDLSTTTLSLRRIIRLAVNNGARYAFLAHNHPSGVALPSKADWESTKQIRDALAVVNVYLSDHFIVAGNECISLADSNMFDD